MLQNNTLGLIHYNYKNSWLGNLNLFGYCNNNPIMYYDPSGHSVILMGSI